MAFDKGYITIDKNYCVRISSDISDVTNGATVEMYFKNYNKTRIVLPDRFLPSKDYLQYHNDVVFEKWR